MNRVWHVETLAFLKTYILGQFPTEILQDCLPELSGPIVGGGQELVGLGAWGSLLYHQMQPIYADHWNRTDQHFSIIQDPLCRLFNLILLAYMNNRKGFHKICIFPLLCRILLQVCKGEMGKGFQIFLRLVGQAGHLLLGHLLEIAGIGQKTMSSCKDESSHPMQKNCFACTI
jgi:hypothetical protein